MNFDKKDIEAVARDRVNRVEKRKTTYWIVGVIVAIMVGYLLAVQYSTIAGIAVCGIGIISFFYYSNTITKKQNTAKKRLLKQWKEEQEAVKE